MDIPNPPKIPLEELVIVSRDYWEYRQRLSDQIQYSSNIQNVHFHLSVSCVLARCNNFVPANVAIPTDFLPYLSNEHKEIIKSKLGIFIKPKSINIALNIYDQLR